MQPRDLSVAPAAFYLPGVSGRPGAVANQRHCLLHPAHGAAPRGAIVYVHPWCEEMNKSRRMVALQARALATAGYSVLQLDLLGCGDSSGDFGDAGWNDWVDDVQAAARWLQQRCAAPLWLWGLRAGCLLAAQAAQRLPDATRLLFWQPAPTGKPLLQQFLRLRLAGDMLDGKARGLMEAMKADLAAGKHVEVAGYQLSAAMAQGLESARLAPSPGVKRLLWLEVSPREDATLAPASAAPLKAFAEAGCTTRSAVVRGPAFWQSTEIEAAPELIATTLAWLAEEAAS